MLFKGVNMKEKKSEMNGVKITPTIRKEIQKIAEAEDRSISYIVNRILEEYIKEKTAK